MWIQNYIPWSCKATYKYSGYGTNHSSYLKKGTCFDSLTSGMREHVSVQSIPDLIVVVSTVIHMDTTAVFVEAIEVKTKIICGILDTANLVGTAFLTGNGNTYKDPKSFNLKDYTANMVSTVILYH